MIETLKSLIETDAFRGYMIIASLIIILGLLIWISVIDIMKKSVTFWKMLVVSSSTIILPLITSFFCGCPYLKWYLMGALVLWVLFLFLNVKFNKDRFVGKADIDLLSALFAENIMFCIWMFQVVEENIIWIKITHVWYSFFLYLLLGALVYVGIFLISFIVQVVMKKKSFKELMKGTKVSVIPMLIPVSVMVPYIIMIS